MTRRPRRSTLFPYPTLFRSGGARDVTVVAPQPVHRYKPLLNYVGGGQAAMADLERPTRDVVPAGCGWVRDSVDAVDVTAMTVRTRGGRTLHCSTLVLCPGLVEDWDATPGLQRSEERRVGKECRFRWS